MRQFADGGKVGASLDEQAQAGAFGIVGCFRQGLADGFGEMGLVRRSDCLLAEYKGNPKAAAAGRKIDDVAALLLEAQGPAVFVDADALPFLGQSGIRCQAADEVVPQGSGGAESGGKFGGRRRFLFSDECIGNGDVVLPRQNCSALGRGCAVMKRKQLRVRI